MRDLLDVIIVGAGPAGLSAALILGRACRRVLVFDHGRPRNRATRHLHGYLTRDCTPPLEFLRMGRDDVARYDTVTIEQAEVVSASRTGEAFIVTTSDGRTASARRLLLATGVVDNVPAVPGLDACYGRSIFHCPYCDGWELRGRPIAVYGTGKRGAGLSLELTGWTNDIVLVTDGPSGLEANELERLARNGIPIRDEPIERLEHRDGELRQIVFKDGSTLAREALFFTTGQTQSSPLARALGCEFNEKGTVRTGPYENTSIPGLYVAGDASRAVQWVVVAAAEGAEAAYAINQDIIRERLR